MVQFLCYFGVWLFGASCGFIIGALWGIYSGIEVRFEEDGIALGDAEELFELEEESGQAPLREEG